MYIVQIWTKQCLDKCIVAFHDLSMNDLTFLILICNVHCSSDGSLHVDDQFSGYEVCMPSGMVVNNSLYLDVLICLGRYSMTAVNVS